MSITDELREWAEDNTLRDRVLTTYPPQHAVHGVLEKLLRIADRIDAEHEKAIRELNNLADASVLLPVDADGEVIHVGDMMERGEARGHVIALMLSEYPKKWGGGLHWGVQLEGEHAPTALDLTFHHYHAPTVEDVLMEFADEMNQNLGMYTGEAIDADEWRDADAKTVEKYAAKLRLADGTDA